VTRRDIYIYTGTCDEERFKVLLWSFYADGFTKVTLKQIKEKVEGLGCRVWGLGFWI
jgi:hypothetical protein